MLAGVAVTFLGHRRPWKGNMFVLSAGRNRAFCPSPCKVWYLLIIIHFVKYEVLHRHWWCVLFVTVSENHQTCIVFLSDVGFLSSPCYCCGSQMECWLEFQCETIHCRELTRHFGTRQVHIVWWNPPLWVGFMHRPTWPEYTSIATVTLKADHYSFQMLGNSIFCNNLCSTRGPSERYFSISWGCKFCWFL